MPKVQLESARTTHADAAAAAEDLLSQITGANPKLVTLFASSDRDQLALNKAVRERLPKSTRLIGATTGGEIDREGAHMGSVVLGALYGDFDVGLGIGRGLTADAIGAGVDAVAMAASEIGIRPADIDAKKHVGLVIDDGSKMKKEELLLGMLEKNQSLILVGGGASDIELDPSKQRAMIHVDGEVENDAALIALFSTTAPWAAMRSHWYLPTGKMLTITKVDDTHTRALEIDGQPATRRYADLLGLESADDLDFRKPRGFAVHPTALKVGREYFMRAPAVPLPDGSILFTNLLEPGTELEIMALGDMAGITRSFFQEEMPKVVRSPQAALLFNCGVRSFMSMAVGAQETMSAIYRSAPPCVGFNVSFELYCGFQINTTLTALVFGESE